jgi:hypothetical protein
MQAWWSCGERPVGHRTRRRHGGCWRLPWCWRDVPAAMPRGSAAWIDRRCATGSCVSMRQVLRGYRIAPARVAWQDICRLSNRTKWLSGFAPVRSWKRMVCWRRVDLQRKIAEAFKVQMHERSVGKLRTAWAFGISPCGRAIHRRRPRRRRRIKKLCRAGRRSHSGRCPRQADRTLVA